MEGIKKKIKKTFKKDIPEQDRSLLKQESLFDYDWVLFQRELFFAIIITAVACCIGFTNVLFMPNDQFPQTADALGHMAKVKYIADCLSHGEIPSWFPYWYSGATVAQYYPLLSYLIMAPIQILTGNTMVTYKIFCFLMLFAGGMGIWAFCRFYIGRWYGLYGSVLYCLQPFLLLAFFAAGVLAQGPIFAFTPWLIIAVTSCVKKPSAKNFFACAILTAILVLSHAMHAFMVCLCIMFVLLPFIPFKKVSFRTYIFIGLAIIWGTVLTAFWFVIGATHLENPTIPTLLGEAVFFYTATLEWFNKSSYQGFFYYAIPFTLLDILALILYIIQWTQKKIQVRSAFSILFCIILTFFTMLFSFGLYLPLFHYLPFSSNMVPGRILSFTSASGAIIGAYAFYAICSFAKGKKLAAKLVTIFICVAIMFGVLTQINPLTYEYGTLNPNADGSFNDMISSVDTSGSNFEKGRYEWLSPVDSSETYFPLLYNLNTCDGWNIEGTPNNQIIWNFITALATDNYDYVSRNLAFWNTRYLLVNKEYPKLVPSLNKKYNFQLKTERGNNYFYYCNTPSSYFLTDSRNALLLGPGSLAVAIEFPFLVKGYSNDITEYSMEELEKYDVIYLCEPKVPTENKKRATEDVISALVKEGKKIIIEPAANADSMLFDVLATDIPLEDNPVMCQQTACAFKSDIKQLPIDKSYNYGRILYGLDESYYTLFQNDKSMHDDVIGIKNIDGGSVLFIGMHLSQQLKAVYARNWGFPEDEKFPLGADETKVLFNDIFKYMNVNFNFWPGNYPVETSEWNYKGGTFTYNSKADQDIIVSVTYAPRWKAYLDGKEIPVGQRDNLIFLSLPAGEHQVTLEYGITKYGKIGYIISIFAAICLFFFIFFYDKIIRLYKKSTQDIRSYLQLPPKS